MFAPAAANNEDFHGMFARCEMPTIRTVTVSACPTQRSIVNSGREMCTCYSDTISSEATQAILIFTHAVVRRRISNGVVVKQRNGRMAVDKDRVEP
jgi:hypothetical protein